MKFLKVLSCNLILNIATALFIDEYMSVPKFDILYPPHYNIHFVLNVTYNLFYGEYNVSIYIPYETQNIYVYTENLSITRIRITNDTQISKKNEGETFAHSPNKFIYNNKTYITTISFPYNLTLGFYTLNMEFTGLLAENGGFRNFMNQQNGIVWLAATHYYKFATRRLFPLLKDTTYASYNISIKHHINYTALSNMPVQEVKMDKNNMQWTRFETTPVMPIYFITAGVVQLHFKSEKNQDMFYRKGIFGGTEFAYTVAKRIARFLEMKLPYIRKTSNINHISIPKLFDAEEITLGLILYREEDIIFDHRTDDEIRKTEIARLVGYKMAQEWLYNVIDPYKWEPWIMKGFATFLGMYAADKKFPELQIQDLFVVQTLHDFLHWSTKDSWPLTIKSEFNNSVKIPYDIKASIMFRTLQTFSKKVFPYGIETYLNYCYTSSNAFWLEMQAIMSEFFKLKYKLEDQITNWTQLNDYPMINVQRNYYKNSLNISIKDFNANIWILNIFTQDSNVLNVVSLDSHISYHVLNSDFVDKDHWILVDSLQSGCYRVNYGAENWEKLSDYLNFNSFERIHVLDRAKIIDDGFHSVMTGQLTYTTFFNISRYLYKETDYIVWYPMLKSLEYMSGFFIFPESELIKEEIEIPLNGVLWNIKFPNFRVYVHVGISMDRGTMFTRCLRQEAARWLCFLNLNDHCLFTAHNELKWHLYNYWNSINSEKIWIGWKEWTLCNGLKTADNSTWMQTFKIYWEKSDKSILKVLPCSQNVDIIERYIHMMRFGVFFKNVTTLDYVNTYTSIVARHAKNNSMFDIILRDFELLRLPVIKQFSAAAQLTMIINHVYSMNQLNKIKEYVKKTYKSLPVLSLINYEVPSSQTIREIRKYEELRRKYRESVVICVNRKLKLRWNQIKTQLMMFRYLAKNMNHILTRNFDDDSQSNEEN